MGQQGNPKKPTNYEFINHAQNLTGRIIKRISTQLAQQKLLPSEQKRCYPGSKFCKDKLLITTGIFGYCNRRDKD
jgi:hypothetical protein